MDIDLGQSFQNVLNTLVSLIPKVLLFLAILLIGWLVAKGVEKAVDVMLERLGFDHLVERGGVRRAMSRSGYDASGIVAKLAYLAVLLFTFQLAFGVFGPNPISELIASIVAWLPKAFVAIIIVVVTAYVAGLVREIVRGSLSGVSYGRVLATSTYVFIFAVGIIAALTQIGVAVAVTGPILWAVLLSISGVLIVGVGGGLIRPMQARWERMLNNVEGDFDLRESQPRSYTLHDDPSRPRPPETRL